MEAGGSRVPESVKIRWCLFMRALEEADPAGERLGMAERVAASGGGEGKSDGAYLVERSRRLGEGLKGGLAAGYARMEDVPRGLPGWLGVAVSGGAFLLGWWTHDLGADGQVSLLAFPLLGLMGWNAAVVAATLLGLARPGDGSGWKRGLPRWLRAEPWSGGDGLADAVVGRAERAWEALEVERMAMGGKRLFHVGALMLAAGVVAGMYGRGLVRHYEAGWESTFLSQGAVSQLLGIVLGPASLVSGVAVPVVPPQGVLTSAAPWIHLWAASAGLFILLPRLVLLSMSGRSRPGWAGQLGEYAAAARRLAGGRVLVAQVLPVQCEPDSPLRDSLRAVLQHLWGGQVMVDFLNPVRYGGEDEALAGLGEAPSHLVLLLPLAVTPEDEVHGALRRGLGQWMERAPGSQGLAVLDAWSFESRLRGMPEAGRRLAERRAAWEKVLGSGWPLLVLDGEARRRPSQAAAALAAGCFGPGRGQADPA